MKTIKITITTIFLGITYFLATEASRFGSSYNGRTRRIPNDVPLNWTNIENPIFGPSSYKSMVSNLKSHIHSTRVIGGKPARPHQFPFQVALVVEFEDKRHWCGGSLLHSGDILTSAYCLAGAVSAIVILGAHDYTTVHEKEQERFIVSEENFIIHEEFNPDTGDNDIAMIYIDESFSETNIYIQGIALGVPPLSRSMKYIATGWGLTSMSGKPPNKLQYVNLKNYENVKRCTKMLLGNQTDIPPHRLICTDGSEGKSMCKGDSGGPLFVKVDDFYVQIGITSFGSKTGCENRLPSAFTRVEEYFDWIGHNSNKHNLFFSKPADSYLKQ